MAAGVLAAAASAPAGWVLAYSLLSGTLGVGTTGNGFQRDFRVFDNFLDATANDNTTPNTGYPGQTGAELALWKSGHVWDSNVGTNNSAGGRNFDFDWQGRASAVGTTNDNTLSGLSGGTCSGGVLAFTETPIADGWRIRICEQWTWNDGPSSIGGSQMDLQGVNAHELGHSLGLGHTQSNFCSGACSARSTMCAFICNNGVSERTIATDDINGLNAKYGAIPANKPVLSSVTGNVTIGGTITLGGSAFAATGNNVKFTAQTSQNTGTIPGVVFNLPSSGGGTSISVTIPSAARDGNVFVWIPSISRLSNPRSIDIAGVLADGWEGPGDPSAAAEPFGGAPGLRGPDAVPAGGSGTFEVAGTPGSRATLLISASADLTSAGFLAAPVAALEVVLDGAGRAAVEVPAAAAGGTTAFVQALVPSGDRVVGTEVIATYLE
jgi:hypothetical protein